MNVTELESLILDGLGRTVRAQQLAGPSLDVCRPGMVSEQARQRLYDAAYALEKAGLQANAAAVFFAQARGLLKDFLYPEHELLSGGRPE